MGETGKEGRHERRHEDEYRYTAWRNCPEKITSYSTAFAAVKRSALCPMVQPSRPGRKARDHDAVY